MNRRSVFKTGILMLLVVGFGVMTSHQVMAQTVFPPPEVIDEAETSEDDILVFQPQLYWEFPFAQGFKISFNFGISFEVPRLLNLVEDDVFNFFLRFRSYVIPAESGTPVSTPRPQITPTPQLTPTPENEPVPEAD